MITADSSKFEKSYFNYIKACKEGDFKKSPFAKMEVTKEEGKDLMKKFAEGLIVFSKGELIEKEELNEEFEIVYDEETNKFEVFPDIYEGDEIIQSTIFRYICDVRLNKNGQECDNGVNHMVKIPKIYWEISKVGRKVSIHISRSEIGRCLAHTVPETGVEKDNVYIGKYLMSENWTSIPGVIPLNNISFDTTQKSLKEEYKGNGYRMMGFHQLTLIQLLYLLRFKSLDSKAVLGRGATDLSGRVEVGGSPNTYFWGEDTGKKSVVMCRIHDFFGNLYMSIDGLQTDDKDVIVWKGTKLEARIPARFGSGILEEVVGMTEFGFTPKF